MDLNELLHSHQVAVMKAAAAGDGPGRDNHFAKVAEYAERVRALRDMAPLTRHQANSGGEAPAIIYGTYAGDTAVPSDRASIASWEEEGGAVRHPESALPKGIEMKVVREYRVGPYLYQDLSLALAEHGRQHSAD